MCNARQVAAQALTAELYCTVVLFTRLTTFHSKTASSTLLHTVPDSIQEFWGIWQDDRPTAQPQLSTRAVDKAVVPRNTTFPMDLWFLRPTCCRCMTSLKPDIVAPDYGNSPGQVPKGFASETELLDKPMSLRVAALARFSVPAIVFQLGGLAASEVHHWVNSKRRRDSCDNACWTHEDPNFRSCRQNENNGQWLIVDELNTACHGDRGGNMLDGAWNLEGTGAVLGEPEDCFRHRCQTTISGALCHRWRRELSFATRTLNAKPDAFYPSFYG